MKSRSNFYFLKSPSRNLKIHEGKLKLFYNIWSYTNLNDLQKLLTNCMFYKYYISYYVIYYYCATFTTLFLLCHTLMLYNYYIILHELHPVILFILSFCVTFLHIFLTMIFLKYLIIVILNFQSYNIFLHISYNFKKSSFNSRLIVFFNL